MRTSIVLAAAFVAASLGSPASADPPAGPAEPRARADRDPNEIICRRVPVLGSRLATQRVCGTRAEMEQRRWDDQQGTERAQMRRVYPY